LDAVAAHARRAPEFCRAVWQEVALPGCEGLYAHARGDYALAWQRLSAAVPRMAETGGSHAQRDLFEQILLDAARRSGRSSVAQHMLELRRSADPNGVPVNTMLAALYTELGLPALAQQAQGRAAFTRSRTSSRDA
jgi:hypothetical protein